MSNADEATWLMLAGLVKNTLKLKLNSVCVCVCVWGGCGCVCVCVCVFAHCSRWPFLL